MGSNDTCGPLGCSYGIITMIDKNEFRHLKENDLIERKPWYRDLYESIREDVDKLLSLIDGGTDDKVQK